MPMHPFVGHVMTYMSDMWVVWCAVSTLLRNKRSWMLQALYCNVYGDPGVANAAV